MRLASVEEVRERQLKLLGEFNDYCIENNITYFAFAGTLLGAVRHKGFIPWDNDIDLAVPRHDYERMICLLKDDSAHPYFRFLCYENDKNYLWQHGRISDKKTYMKTVGGYKKLGLSIDIFPLDNQGDSLKKAKKNLRKIHKCVQFRIMAYDKKYKKLHYPKGNFFRKAFTLFEFYCIGHSNQEYWVKKNIKLAPKFNNIGLTRFFGCNSNDKYTVVCERNEYEHTIPLDFENTKIPAPNGFHTILTKYYGDYMSPPKRKEQTYYEKNTCHLFLNAFI